MEQTYLGMDYQTYRGVITAGSVAFSVVSLYLLRRYRPTKRIHDFLWKRIKNERLRKMLFTEV